MFSKILKLKASAKSFMRWLSKKRLTSVFSRFVGFNTIETKIRTPDGKVWAEDDFQNLSREIYKDLTQQLAGIHSVPDCYIVYCPIC